ncbi:hypothetical protein CEXT_278211 [Caerostris extrusa]|uniref:Reverse transcriptase domain-containing protein n=1 Tax=Caerostris extrusa TaxID=172846 RepID=A0AAV4W1R9_CAEEX|nr:hypothetical protein CEXT_278211 [Caerostris extrusa]
MELETEKPLRVINPPPLLWYWIQLKNADISWLSSTSFRHHTRTLDPPTRLNTITYLVRGTIFNRSSQICTYVDLVIISRNKQTLKESLKELENTARKIGLEINEKTRTIFNATALDPKFTVMGMCVFRMKSSQKTRHRATRRGLLNDGPPLAVLSPLSLQSLPLLNHPVMYSNSFLPSISIQCAVII